MYQMVEELDDGRKVLFLTGEQAHVIESSDDIFRLMLTTLEITSPDPKLVINLLPSLGLSNQLNDTQTNGEEKHTRRAAFVHKSDELLVEERLDSFMSEVIIPLAARTHAVVLVNPHDCQCHLARSFNRMVLQQQAKWGGKLPAAFRHYQADLY